MLVVETRDTNDNIRCSQIIGAQICKKAMQQGIPHSRPILLGRSHVDTDTMRSKWSCFPDEIGDEIPFIPTLFMASTKFGAESFTHDFKVDSIKSSEKSKLDSRNSSRLEKMAIIWKKTSDCGGNTKAGSDRDVMGRLTVQIPAIVVYSNKIATSIRQELDAYPELFATICDPPLNTTLSAMRK